MPDSTPVYFYDRQLTRYINQFMNVFAGMHVEVGNSLGQPPRLARVPIVYGSKDRVAASIMGQNTQNKPLRLPTFGAYFRGLQMAPGRRKGIPTERRTTVMPQGGVFPNDIKVVHQMMPVPYLATYELSIYTSNMDQMFQIEEQILTLFDPLIQFQTSDDPLDWTQIVTLELMTITNEENYPAADARRIIQTTMSFDAVIYMTAPSNIREDYIADIKVRLGVVSNTTNFANSQDVVAQLDAQGIPYNEIFNLDDVDIDKTPST